MTAASSTSGTPTITSPSDSETATFTTTYGTASTEQTFSVAGSNLTAAITATAPAGFEVSSNGTSWASTATFTPSSGTVSGATLHARLAATAPVSGTYNDVDITLASTGATTVTLTTPATGNAVTPASLEITANDVIKPFGDTLNEINPGSAAFTSSGLVNDETIGSVTITYLDGFEAGDAAQVYPNAVVPSAATGGSFTPGNYNITYMPGDLTVTSDPVIELAGSLTPMTAVYGTPSTAQSFTVSGSGLTGNLVVTAPAGYQVSETVDSGYAPTVTLTPVSGSVALTTLHVRLRADTPAGAVAAGNVTAESVDAVTQNLPVPAGNVTAKELTITGLTGVNKTYDRTTDGSFTGTPVLNGVVAGDEADVELDDDTVTATFSQTAPGTDLTLTLAGFALTGLKAGNYSLTQPVLSADIDPKELTLLNPAVVTKTYNGTTAATITGTLDGVIAPDVVTFNGTGIFDNAGPGAPIAVTAAIVLTGADAGNYTLVQPTGLSGRINGSATGGTIAQWLFNGETASAVPGGVNAPIPTLGSGTAVLVGGTTGAFNSGVSEGGSSDTTSATSPPNFGWGITNFAASGTGNKTRGVQFSVSTVGSTGIKLKYDLRASNSGSRFVQVQYTLNGNDWIDFGDAQAIATAGVTWFNGNIVDFSLIAGADNNPNFGVRLLAAFDPAGSNYVTANTGTAYATTGTWRFDRVEFSGNPPFHFVSSNPNHGATEVATNTPIQLTFTKPALLSANAVTLVDEDSNPISFTGLPVTTAASVVTLTPAGLLPFGKAITVTLVRDEINDGVDTLESTTATIPIVFTTEAAVAPVVNVTPASLELPINTTGTLTANVTAGSAPVTLQWYEGDAGDFGAAILLDGETGTTLEVSHPTVGTRTFFVRATNAANESANSNNATVTFSNFVLVTSTTPENGATAVLPDTAITLNFSKPVKIQAGGVGIDPAVPFTLSPGFDTSEFHSTYTLTPNNPLALDTTYTVTVAKDFVEEAEAVGMAENFQFSFTTLVPVTIIQEPDPQNTFLGGSASFSVLATGDGPLSYDWRRNNVSLGAPNLPTLTLTNVQLSQAGNYSVVVTGPGTGNSATSIDAPLTVTVPAISISGDGTYSQDFDSMGTTNSVGYPFAWKGFKYAGNGVLLATGSAVTSATNPLFTAGNGGSATGTIYNFGSAGTPNDRALGMVASAGFMGAIGVSFRNDTNEELEGSNVAIGFTAEQWRTSGETAKERLRFEWKIGGTINATSGSAIDTAGWNPVSTFDIVEVDGGSSSAAVDGNAGSFRAVIPSTAFSTLSGWGPGQVLHLRWVDTDDAGTDAGLAIDDFSFVVSDVPPPPVYAYWDANGATAGAGGPTPAGTWGTDNFWSDDAAGEAATLGWVAAGDAVFSAGSDATGVFTVTLDGLQDAGTLTFEEGTVSLAGDGLLLSRLPARVDVLEDATASISSVISGANGLRKRGEGMLHLLGANLFTGPVRLGGGVVSIDADSALGDVDNDLILAGGALAVTTTLTLPDTRGITGSGTLLPAAGTTLTVAGPVDTVALTLGTNGNLELTNTDTLSIGLLTLTAESTVSGAPLTLQNVTASLNSASATISNDLLLGGSTRVFNVDAGSLLTLSGDVTLGGGAALSKIGPGRLQLTGDNSALFRVSIGTQGATPVSGGIVQIDNNTALGANPVFFNYGTLDTLTPLTGVNALPVGASMGGRDAAPVMFSGSDIELAGNSSLFSAGGTSGDIVILVSNTTIFSGPFAATPSASVDSVRFGGTGTVVLSGPKDTFRAGLKLAGTVTLVLDTDQLGDVTSANPLISLAPDTKVVIGGTDSTRLVTAYHRLEALAGSSIDFEIGGTTRGTQYDAIDFLKGTPATFPDISAAATFNVTFLPGYTPQAGHAFRLIHWSDGAAVDLASVTLNLPALPVDSGLTWDTGNFESQGLIVIVGPGMGPVIVTHPQPESADINDDVTFFVEALGTGLNYDWKRNGVSLGAPNTNTLSLLGVDATRAGIYSVTVSNENGITDSNPAALFVDGMPFIVTQPQSAAVVDGTPVEFSVTAFGPAPLTYQWQFGTDDLDGETGPTLTRTSGPLTHGNYRVIVSAGVGKEITSVVAVLSGPVAGPPNQKPEWNYAGDLPPGQIGLAYSFKPGIKPDDPANNIFRSATSFTVTGLPTGLGIDRDTGEISGIPGAIKATPYTVKITARNVAGSVVLTTRILINPLPTGTAGTFTGMVSRSELLADIPNDLNGPLGGRLDFTVAATGRVSGKITLGARVFSFRSQVTVDPDDTTQVKMTAAIKRKNLTDLVIELTLTGTGVLADASVSDGVAPLAAAIEGWRNPWSKANRADQPGAHIAGYYTLKMELVQPQTPYTSAEAPLGVSYLSFTVNPTTGRLTLKGRLADGSNITMATFAGPAGQILLFRTLYAAKVRGSILGMLEIEALPDPAQNTLTGALDWSRPANLAKSNRLYRNGFPDLLELAATGGRYLAPAKNVRVLGLTDLDNLVEVLFSEANLEDALPPATVEGMKGQVAANNKVTFSSDFGLVNTRRAKLTFTAKTGAFRAQITLTEENPLLPGSGKQVKRVINAQGLLVGGAGAGYGIVNQLPAVAGDTPGNTPQESGKVVVAPVPPVEP